ncbi:MAG: lytic transglycosylase domain-containing protein [Thermodesulfovibrionaceae bacterium]
MLILIIFVIIFVFCNNVWAEKLCIRIIDGKTVYTNLCNNKSIIYKKNTKPPFYSSLSLPLKTELEKIVEEKAKSYGVDAKLIKEVIREESNWNPYAISPKGAMGIMQLMPQTAILLGVKNPFDPIENIDAGIRYMKYLLEKFDGNISLALAAYNAGPSLVESLGRIPNIVETQNYVRRISFRYNGTTSDSLLKSRPIKAIILFDGTVIYTNREDMYIWSKMR